VQRWLRDNPGDEPCRRSTQNPRQWDNGLLYHCLASPLEDALRRRHSLRRLVRDAHRILPDGDNGRERAVKDTAPSVDHRPHLPRRAHIEALGERGPRPWYVA